MITTEADSKQTRLREGISLPPVPGTITLWSTTIGKKAALAVSGLVLFGFVLGHMIGNLQIFLGPEVFNRYAESIKGNPPLLWGTRTLLLASVIVHVAVSVNLYSRSIAARKVGYRVKRNVATSYAASVMKYSGPALLLYILFHLAHFTAPGLSLGELPHDPTNVYANVVSSFRVPWVTAIYVVANALLGLHLYHGSWSLFQSLGASHPRYDAFRRRACVGLAMVITAGNVIMPLAVLVGVVS